MNSLMNNPVSQLVQVARSGGNPMNMIRQMAGSDPRMNQFMKMVSGKNPQQLQTMAANMAKERGMTLDEVIQGLGLR